MALLGPVQFLLIPYIIGKVGAGGYGTWVLILVFINMSSLADLGLAGTLTKHAAEYYARDDFTSLNRLIDTGLSLYLAIALLVMMLLGGASPILVRVLFKGSAIPARELAILWMCNCVIVGIGLLSAPYYSVLLGLQRMDFTNALNLAQNLLRALLTVVFLHWGWGLRGLVGANFAGLALALLVNIWIVRKLLPELRTYPFDFNWAEVRHIFDFSLKVYLTQIAITLDTQISKLYVGMFVGVTAAGWFNIASDTAMRIRKVPELLLSPVMAAASELDARGDSGRLRELYFRSHKYIALFGLPLVFYLAFASHRLVYLWLGSAFGVVAIPLAVLTLVHFFNLTTGPGYLMLMGQGVLRPGIKSAIFGLILDLSLGLPLTYEYGFLGALFVTCLTLVTASLYFLYLFERQTHISFLTVAGQAYLKPSVCALVLLSILSMVSPWGYLHWVGLAVQGLLFGVLYFLCLMVTKFFDDFDLRKAESVLPMARLARRMVSLAS
jgi:O-antigen/teichoic acid export membrane protein